MHVTDGRPVEGTGPEHTLRQDIVFTTQDDAALPERTRQ